MTSSARVAAASEVIEVSGSVAARRQMFQQITLTKEEEGKSSSKP